MLGALIGRGNTAEVFDAGDNKVIKLFNKGYPLQSVRYEFKNSKLLNNLDVPIVKSYELVMLDGRHGIVYDRVDGESMLELILKTEDLAQYSIVLAELHQVILNEKLPKAVSLKHVLASNIKHTDKLSRKSKKELAAILKTLPDGDTFCHGDFHFGNIIADQGKYRIIDYMNVCRGCKYGDIARTVYLIEKTPVPAELSSEARDHLLYLKRKATDIYLDKMGVSRDSLADWSTVITAARLAELRNDEKTEIDLVLNCLSTRGFEV